MSTQRPIIIDSDEPEEQLGYDKNPSAKSQLHDESSSSSTLSALSNTSQVENDSFDSVQITPKPNKETPPNEEATKSEFPKGRIFVSKHIFKDSPKDCPPLAPIHEDNTVSATPDNSETTNKSYRLLLPKVGPSQSRQSNKVRSQSLILCRIEDEEKGILSPVPGAIIIEKKKTAAPDQMVVAPHFLQNDHDYPKLMDIDSHLNVIKRTFNFPAKQIVREHRVYIQNSKGHMYDNFAKSKGIKKVHPEKVEKIVQSCDEQDPLYIPDVQEKILLPCSMGETNKIKKSVTSQNQTNNNKKNVKELLAPAVFPDNKRTSSSIGSDQHIPKAKKPKVALTKSMNSEHSIVKNYAVQNKIPKEKNPNVDNSKPRLKKSTDPNLIYGNRILLECTPVINSDYCRNFFIKNSAWDYLEPQFKGFNEREEIISKSCLEFFNNISDNLRRTQCKPEPTYSINDLFYTRKIELLNEEGKLEKVLIIPPQGEVRPIHPPIKNCKIVLEKNEIVENKLKLYLLQEKLNSFLLDVLSFSKADALKPLIVLNKHNFNVLKINDVLCKHSNIIYVKNAEEKFPERLLKNNFLVSQIEQRSIKVISPNALKTFFM